jgi:hypothetical protein
VTLAVPAALLLACAQPAASGAAPQPVRKAVALPACIPKARGMWRFVAEQQLGVDARGRGGTSWVGMTAATDGFHDWAPFDDWKTTMCGELRAFRTFEPTRQNKLLSLLPEIPEHDWNIIVVPTPRTIFDERFKLATKLMERGHETELESCGNDDCLEGEVTPRGRLLKANVDRQWLSACRLRRPICMWGPWVGDGGHGFRPEIHPAERIWWRDGDRIHLVFVQDASQRFGDRRNYQWKWGQREPASWYPWAVPGLQGEFRVAFEARSQSSVTFVVEQLLDENTRPVDAARRAGGSRLQFDLGASGVTVDVTLRLGAHSERLDLDLTRLDVDVVDVCDRGDGTLQGFLHIGDKVGYRFLEGEGFDAFAVIPPPPLVPLPSTEPATCSVSRGQEAEELVGSLQLTAIERDIRDHSGQSSQGLLRHLLRGATERKPSQGAAERLTAARTDLVVASARRFQLDARPHYEGPRAERIEAAVGSGNGDELRRQLAATPLAGPRSVRWELEIKDFDTGSVYSGPYTFRCRKRLLDEDECALELPGRGPGGPDQVLGVRATAQLLASDGVTTLGKHEIRLASHFVRASKSDSADKVFAWLASGQANGDRLKDAARAETESWPDLDDLTEYRRGYYARMLRHGVALATNDGRITLDELRQFVDMAHEFSELDTLSLDRPLVAPRAK